MSKIVFQYALYIAIVVVLAIPLGAYIAKVMNGEHVFLSKLFSPCEKALYKVLGVNKDEQMSAKQYFVSVVLFGAVGFVVLFLLQLFQGVLPANPAGAQGMSWHLAFNNAASFVTNTNWQAYSGEGQASYLTQALGLTVQNFGSAAVGISVLFALIRGFVKVKSDGIGSFWVDVTRSILYILLPLSLVLSLGLVSQGVVQSMSPAGEVTLLEPVAVDSQGQVLQGAIISGDTVFLDGVQIPNAKVITKQFVPMGPAAGQIAIKQLGTNGGGFFGANSAHPFENPNAISNLLEMISILLIPAALCFSFGKSIKDTRQGKAIFLAMGLVLVVALAGVGLSEQKATPQLAQNGAVYTGIQDQAGGNMQGKETRFGIVESSTWAVFTTCASNGSTNASMDSFTPLGGMVSMLLIALGEVVFGGVGSGLYGMLCFAILTVFIAGLMVGRTPEYLGKKIEPYEMRWAVLVCLATPVAILVGSGIAALVPSVADSVTASGPHGFSQLLYAYTSAGGNNGSAFAGLMANTPFLNVSLGLCMLFARFAPIAGSLFIANSLAKKKKIATTVGTLSTCNGMFVFLLIFVVLLIGALSFFPALALGPIAEHLAMYL